ncbi:MAG: hypothetical protein AUH42_03525 [Gemmatimonadetes bacterium 13_1_40CM_70_11]|nr:MAG: hypothetical protein AUH42_03525 [Gemmatimonadetes bacterium 13_1_40CM_70_11]
MTKARRRWGLVAAVAVLVVILVGGRWLALDTAERAWAASLPAGGVYLDARALARVVRLAILLLAVAWGTIHVYFVYRAIGSVQMPRRLGNLEIVEAVPQRVLLAVTLASGLILGIGLSWGTGDWWRQAALATAPPQFGITDPVLGKDLGYYVGELPWADTRQSFALLAAATATVIVALLYLGIGSLRFAHGRPLTSPHARGHLGVLLACIAAALAWGAWLDPAEVVGGLHGAVDRALLNVRLPGATVVAVLAVAAALASLAWGWRGRAGLLGGTWAALLLALVAVYGLLPAIARADRDLGPPYPAQRAVFERLAFGADGGALQRRAPPQFAGVEQTLETLPQWDAGRIAMVLGRTHQLGPRTTVGGVALATAAGTRAWRRWIVVPAPDDSSLLPLQPQPSWDSVHRGAWAHAGPPLAVQETDTGEGLALVPLAGAPAQTWFGPGFGQFAVADTTGGEGRVLRAAGIRLEGGWRRLALAWVLQSPELARAGTRGSLLLWRRDVTERLARGGGEEGALWWLAYGYVESEAFPLARPLPWRDRRVAYHRAGLLGGVNAVSGETRLWFAPGTDSLTAAWARLFAPLVQPFDSLPAGLRAQLAYPAGGFRLAAAALARLEADSLGWVARPSEPFELVAPPPDSDGGADLARWTAQGFESTVATQTRFEALLAGTVTPAGPRLFLWRPPSREPRPPDVLGAADTKPGVLRLWPASGELLAAQAQFAQAIDTDGVPRLLRVYLSLGNRRGVGATPLAALRNMLSGPAAPADTTLLGRWREARRLAAKADSALAAGDLEGFAALYRRLSDLLKLAHFP